MKNTGLIIGAVIVALVAFSSLFVVPQTKQALVLQFGQPKRIINQEGMDPGLKIKVPVTENVILFERRILDLQPNTKSEVVAADQERLEVNSFVRWRITNPLRFYQRVSTESVARARLESLLEASMRKVLGSASSSDIISGRRAALMADIKNSMNAETRDWGIEIVDVKIRAADLPQANEERVYQRMRSEREQAAAQVRADGDRKAQEVRGQADRERAKIIADAYNQDPDFAAFYRSMQAYDKSFPEGTNLVVSPDSDYFRYFKSRNGK